MVYTFTAKKDDLKGLFDIESMPDIEYKVTITPITEDDNPDEIEFKSLKGIAGKPLNLDEVRKERLHL